MAMEKIDTISAQYIFMNSAAYSRRINRNTESVAESGQEEQKPQAAQSSTKIGLTASQLSVIEKLQSRDHQVRAHEMAHVSAGGQYVTSGVNFTYQKGPDGTMYAVGGEVGIDLSPIANNPQATITKMMVVRNAALAPSDPSPQDRAVAGAASRTMSLAQAELLQTQTAPDEKEGKDSGTRVNGGKLYEDSSESLKGETIDISA